MNDILRALSSAEPLGRYEQRKLKPSDVATIRARYAADPRPTQKALAREFGVTQPQISKIVRKKHWKD